MLGVSWRLQFLPFSHFQSRTISFFCGKASVNAKSAQNHRQLEVEERGRKVYGPIFRSFPPLPIYTKAKANSAAICVNDEEEIKGLGAWWGRSDLEFNARRRKERIDFSATIFGKNIAMWWRKCIPMDPPLCQRLCPVPSRK